MPNLDSEYASRAYQALARAAAMIDRRYFDFPTATETREAEFIYRERVYCYELYHQWRRGFEEAELDLDPPLICGEVAKVGNKFLSETEVANTIPDFIVHYPGSRHNLLVLEVKHGNNLAEHFAADIVKLNNFLQPSVGYEMACLLIFGMNKAKWDLMERRIKSLVLNNLLGENLTARVYVMLQEEAGQNPIPMWFL